MGCLGGSVEEEDVVVLRKISRFGERQSGAGVGGGSDRRRHVAGREMVTVALVVATRAGKEHSIYP